MMIKKYKHVLFYRENLNKLAQLFFYILKLKKYNLDIVLHYEVCYKHKDIFEQHLDFMDMDFHRKSY